MQRRMTVHQANARDLPRDGASARVHAVLPRQGDAQRQGPRRDAVGYRPFQAPDQVGQEPRRERRGNTGFEASLGLFRFFTFSGMAFRQ